LPFAAKDPQASKLMADPEGAAHGWAAFSVEPRRDESAYMDIRRAAAR
jgi:hypothetical protein